MAITFVHHGDFSKAQRFLERCKEAVNVGDLDRFGKAGVQALQSATPRKTGKTANSWKYNIVRKNGSVTIEWLNANIVDGTNIAVILQYGHATRNGGYVQGRDYINPAIQPIFDKIAEEAWKEVSKL